MLHIALAWFLQAAMFSMGCFKLSATADAAQPAQYHVVSFGLPAEMLHRNFHFRRVVVVGSEARVDVSVRIVPAVASVSSPHRMLVQLSARLVDPQSASLSILYVCPAGCRLPLMPVTCVVVAWSYYMCLLWLD